MCLFRLSVGDQETLNSDSDHGIFDQKWTKYVYIWKETKLLYISFAISMKAFLALQGDMLMFKTYIFFLFLRSHLGPSASKSARPIEFLSTNLLSVVQF